MKCGQTVLVASPGCRHLETRVLAHLAIALFGGALFLRIVAKDKHRRQRHLLMRLAEHEKRMAEQEEAAQKPAEKAEEQSTSENEAPYEATAIGQAA